jgi:hypothetical protein
MDSPPVARLDRKSRPRSGIDQPVPKALPLHHPTAAELHAAHDTYVKNEGLDYAYRVGRHMLGDGAAAGFTAAEAIDLLMRVWNAQSPYTWKLTLDAIATLLAQTAQARAAFDDRDIASLAADEVPAVGAIYGDFRAVLGPVGAAKALGLLHPRVFPLWDTAIGVAYIGHKWSQDLAPPAYYQTFVGYCAEQCTTAVNEAAFGPTLLKRLDEWNFCVWTKGWLANSNA